MSSSRRGGTKLQNRAVTAVALSSNENHSSNALGEVICVVATMIGPTWQRLNVATGAVTASTHCYYNICVKIWHCLLPFKK
jgi:hypothetical protein